MLGIGCCTKYILLLMLNHPHLILENQSALRDFFDQDSWVMIVMVIVMVIVPRILLKILTITNNHYLGSSKSPALRLWGSDGSSAHSSAFHESSPFRKVSQLGFSCFRKCISFATILHDLFSSFRKVLSSHLIAQICNFISFLAVQDSSIGDLVTH